MLFVSLVVWFVLCGLLCVVD